MCCWKGEQSPRELWFAFCMWATWLPYSAVTIILGNCRRAESTLQNYCTPSSQPDSAIMTKAHVRLPSLTLPLSLAGDSRGMETSLAKKNPHFFCCWKVWLEKTVSPTICYSCPASIKGRNKKVLKILLSKQSGGQRRGESLLFSFEC